MATVDGGPAPAGRMLRPPGRPEPRWLAPLARFAWVPLALLAALFCAGLALNSRGGFDPPWLLPPLNAIFQTLLPLLVAAGAYTAYRVTGVVAVLALGMGALAIGLGSGLVSAVFLYTAGGNAAVSMHNCAVLLAGALQLAAALLIAPGRGLPLLAGAGSWALSGYLAVTGCLAVPFVLIVTGRMPTFIIPGLGSTPLRLAVLGTALGCFALAAALWRQTYVVTGVAFLRWYWMGLALFTIGLAGVLAEHAVGNPVSWAGRAGQFLAAPYLLLAVLAAAWAAGGETPAHGTLGAAMAQATLAYRPLVESAAEAVALVDRAGRVLYWNDAARRLFGPRAEEIFGQPLASLTAREPWRAQLRAYLGDGGAGQRQRAGQRLELTLAGPGGREFPAEVVLYRSSQPRPGSSVCLISDITERRAAEDRLRNFSHELEGRVAERTRELETANRELEAFSYTVSHDLRAPLRALDGFSQLLSEGYQRQLDQKGRHYLARIRASAQRMGAMIDELLQLSQVSHGPLRREPADLSGIARQLAGELQAAEPDRDVRWVIQEGLTAEADPQLLRIVLQNLLANAWKFTATRRPARIELGAGRRGGCPEFYVRDNGVGFDMAQAGLLFQPFRRLHRADEFPGSGIGLATVQRIVARHGGRIRAHGEPGRGATFTFTLTPAAPGGAHA